MSSRISMAQCKTRLTTIWFAGSGVVFALIFAQTIGGRYGDHVNEAWSWLLPNIMPTLSLITGVLVADSLGKSIQIKSVNRFLFHMAFWLSGAYLLTITLTILLWPITNELEPLTFLQKSSTWLAPFQGLITGLMGAFFIQNDVEKEPKSEC
jgi:hypothetical protein